MKVVRFAIYSGSKENPKLRWTTDRFGTIGIGVVIGEFGHWSRDTKAMYPKNGVCYVSREVLTDSGEWIADNPDGGVAYREETVTKPLYMET